MHSTAAGDPDLVRWGLNLLDGGGGPTYDASGGAVGMYEGRAGGSRYGWLSASELDPPRVEGTQTGVAAAVAARVRGREERDGLYREQSPFPWTRASGAEVGADFVYEERGRGDGLQTEAGQGQGSPRSRAFVEGGGWDAEASAAGPRLLDVSVGGGVQEAVPVMMAKPAFWQMSTANDEVIAQALQEEFTHLATLEARKENEKVQSAEERFEREFLAQDWSVQRKAGMGRGGRSERFVHEGAGSDDFDREDWRSKHEEFGWNGGATASCSGGGQQASEDYDRSIALVLGKELGDEEVSKRLTHLDSIPHVPRINGLIPSMDDASEDHRRLSDRLELYGLCENKIQGDGNCQFRALSDQLYGTPEQHKAVRKAVVEQLKYESERYEGYVPMKYSEYVKKMARNGEWGDHVTLQAAADHYGVKISLVTSFRDTCFIEITPCVKKSERVIWLSFWAEVHYNSIYPEGGAPDAVDVKKKKYWLFF